MTTIAMENINYKEEIRRKTSKPLMWIGIVSIIMFFGGLTSAVIVGGGNNVLEIEIPFAFTISTLVIILSSCTFHFALSSVKRENYNIAKISIVATLVLGLLFVLFQLLGWQGLHDGGNGIYFAGKESRLEGSFIYFITAAHIAHVIGGLISLVVVLVKTMKERYSLDNLLGMQVSITYWHFLGALWIYLFFFLRFITA